MNEGFVESYIRGLPDNGHGIAFDIGANHGSYTNLMAEKFSIVYAFEPEPTNLLSLYPNVAKSPNVTVVEKAISNVTAKKQKLYTSGNPGGHSISYVVAENHSWGHDETVWIEIEMITIDDFVAQNIKRLDFMKVDVEGAEAFIFDGGVHTLKTCKPDIILEVHQTVPTEVLFWFFRNLGYKWYDAHLQTVMGIKNDEHYLLSTKRD